MIHVTTDELLVTYGLGNAGVHTILALKWFVKSTRKAVTTERKAIITHHVYHHKRPLKRCHTEACASL